MKTLEQKKIKESSILRTFVHFAILVLLFVLLLFLNKEYSLLIPISYLIFISMAQFIRLKTTNRTDLKIYSKTFFKVLEFFILLIIFALIIIGVLA